MVYTNNSFQSNVEVELTSFAEMSDLATGRILRERKQYYFQILHQILKTSN